MLTREHGYELALDPALLDAHRFERLVTAGAPSWPPGGPKPPSRRSRKHSALWRGSPLDDLAYESFAQHEIARLEDLHMAAHRSS